MLQNNLGIANRNRIRGERAENLEAAICCYSNALKVLTREAFPQQWVDIQNNLGTAYFDYIRGERAENLEAAIRCFSDALDVCFREGFREKGAMLQNNLGNIYINRIWGEKAENLEAAIRYFLAALHEYTREAFSERWAMVQNNLGNAYCKRIEGERTENLEAAIRCFLAALQEYTREACSERWAMVQNNLGNVYINRIQGEKAENLETAIRCFLAALGVRTRETFPQDHATTQFNLGRAYQEARQFPDAYIAFAASIDTVESLRLEIVSGDEVKRKLAEEFNRIYRRIVDVCLELAKDDLKYYNQTLEYVERSKARNLVELLANKNLYPKHDLYPSPETYQTHCDQLNQLRREIPTKQRQLEVLISSRESQERYRDEIEQQRHELNHLQQQRDNLLGEINKVDSSFTFSQKVEPIFFRDIQTLTDDRTAIVQWYITGSQILTFIITRHNSHPFVVSSSPEDMKALEGWDKEYRDVYRQQKSQWIINLASPLQQLAEILHIDDILSSINDIFEQKGARCDRLILIPHRYLHLFPLHALPVAGGNLLLDRFPKGVGYAPSCQLLQLAKDQEQQRPDFSHLFAIENPTRSRSKPLLGAKLEVDRIRQHFDPNHSIVLAEAEATEVTLSQRMNQLRSAHCVHFSCHGVFKPESPLESALLLADPEGKLSADANLTLGKIFEKLYLNQCRLVTFSACESGMTDPTSISDEYIGLPSGFLYAGSLSIVSTLWTVDPLATTLLMVKFYKNLKPSPELKAGDVALALKKAQTWLRTLTSKKLARIQNHPNFQRWVEQAFENLPKRDRNKFHDLLYAAVKREPCPFANPYYWSCFVATGL
jgi:CHAT domain-containing protein